MRLERYYIYVILPLALVLNWVVDGSDSLGKTDLNLGLLPKKTLIILEFLQALFLGYILVKYRSRKIYTWAFFIALFLGFELILHIILGNSITIWISGVRYYFSFVPLFFLGYIYGTRQYIFKNEFRVLLSLILLQVPVSIWQFFQAQIRILGTGQLYYDAIAGTMGGFAPNLMSMVVSIGVIYFLLRFINERKARFAIVAFFLLIPPVISEAKGMYLVLIIISLYLVQVSKLDLKRILMISSVVFVLVFGFIYAYQSLDFGLSQAKSFELSYIYEYTITESGRGRLSRIDSIIYALKLILTEESPFFGMGIGSANSNPLGVNPPYNDFMVIRHSVDTLITETGILGPILLGWFIVITFRKSRRLIKLFKFDDPFYRDMINLSGGITLVLLLGIFWEDILFRVQFMYPFSLIIGYIYGLNAIKTKKLKYIV